MEIHYKTVNHDLEVGDFILCGRADESGSLNHVVGHCGKFDLVTMSGYVIATYENINEIIPNMLMLYRNVRIVKRSKIKIHVHLD